MRLQSKLSDMVIHNKLYRFYSFFAVVTLVQSEMGEDHCKYKLVTDGVQALLSKHFYFRE